MTGDGIGAYRPEKTSFFAQPVFEQDAVGIEMLLELLETDRRGLSENGVARTPRPDLSLQLAELLEQFVQLAFCAACAILVSSGSQKTPPLQILRVQCLLQPLLAVQQGGLDALADFRLLLGQRIQQ